MNSWRVAVGVVDSMWACARYANPEVHRTPARTYLHKKLRRFNSVLCTIPPPPRGRACLFFNEVSPPKSLFQPASGGKLFLAMLVMHGFFIRH